MSRELSRDLALNSGGFFVRGVRRERQKTHRSLDPRSARSRAKSYPPSIVISHALDAQNPDCVLAPVRFATISRHQVE